MTSKRDSLPETGHIIMTDNTTQPVSEKTRVTRAAGVVGAATLLSRIFGLVRDVVIAWFFGAGMSADAFFVAFRIPNLLRRLFAEGSLSVAFVPVFTESLSEDGKDDAFGMARSAFRLLALILLVTSLAGILLSPWIIRIIAPGFTDDPLKFLTTVRLTRIVFPYIFFIGLVALSMGVLNVLGHFAAPALAPVMLNLAMIGSVFLISPLLDDPITGLAIGVLIGGALQLALQVPFLVRKGFRFWQQAGLYHPRLKQVGTLMVPTIFGSAVYQINILVGTLLASLLPAGSVSYLYYADRLVQFPLGIFAIALATAVLPSLSRQAAANDLEAVKDTFGYALRLVFFITLPAMVGLIVLREPIVAILFKRGAFDIETTRNTAYALLCYGVGLWAFSAVRIVVNTFYALQDTRTPVRMAVISVAANILLGVVLMQWLAHGGLALATSLASMLNLGLLLLALRGKLGQLGFRKISISVVRSAICAVLMGLAVGGVGMAIIPALDGGFVPLLISLVASILVGVILYTVLAIVMKCGELSAVYSMILGSRSRSHDQAR